MSGVTRLAGARPLDGGVRCRPHSVLRCRGEPIGFGLLADSHGMPVLYGPACIRRLDFFRVERAPPGASAAALGKFDVYRVVRQSPCLRLRERVPISASCRGRVGQLNTVVFPPAYRTERIRTVRPLQSEEAAAGTRDIVHLGT